MMFSPSLIVTLPACWAVGYIRGGRSKLLANAYHFLSFSRVSCASVAFKFQEEVKMLKVKFSKTQGSGFILGAIICESKGLGRYLSEKGRPICREYVSMVIGAKVKLGQDYAVVPQEDYQIQGFKGKTFQISRSIWGSFMIKFHYRSIRGWHLDNLPPLDTPLVLLDLSVYDVEN